VPNDMIHPLFDAQHEAEERAIRRLSSDEDLSLDELDRLATTLEHSRQAYCRNLATSLRRCMAERAAFEVNRDARWFRIRANIDRLSEIVAKAVVIVGAAWLVVHAAVELLP
jgi:hypothetical protein